jgi:hypothetical protein
LQIQINKSFGIFKDIVESQIYPSFIVDKSGKILYSNKGGAQIMSKRFDPLFLGKKTSINCVQDLVHESSNDKKDANDKENHIAILQNIKLQKDCQDLTEGIASLVINNNLVYYKVKAFSSNWKSGNWVILTCENMMGQLIEHKFVTSKSCFIMSVIENLTSEFEQMFEWSVNNKEISMKRWINTLSDSYKILNDFQTMNTLLSYTHGNSNEYKIESINLIETINYVSNIITMSSTNHEFDVDLSYEDGIPDVVYGNMTIFKQIMSILLTLGHKNANSDNSTSWHVKFLRRDETDNYIIGIDVGIPKGDNLQISTLEKIFKNDKLGPDFFFEFKEELQIYDLGMFMW